MGKTLLTVRPKDVEAALRGMGDVLRKMERRARRWKRTANSEREERAKLLDALESADPTPSGRGTFEHPVEKILRIIRERNEAREELERALREARKR